MVMVDISDKPSVFREATATGIIKLKPGTVNLIKKKRIAKGDPICTSRIAAILGAKKTSDNIPLCHPLSITKVSAEAQILDETRVSMTVTVKAKAQTGVEMEALTGTAIGLLTFWDMVKQYEKDPAGQYPSTIIEEIKVTNKSKKDA